MLRDSLQQGKRPLLTVTSNSMAPLFYRDDQIQIEAAAVDDLQPGDVVVFGSAGGLMAHRYWGRLTAVGEVCLVTRGDRQASYDAPWPATRLLGRVCSRRRGSRQIHLTRGHGRWLNRRLTQLAAWEVAHFWPRRQDPLVHEPLSAGGRVTRRLVQVMALLLATAVTLVDGAQNVIGFLNSQE
jgi:hypothetical protein